MKKIRLLMPILGISVLATSAISLAGCSCKSIGGDDKPVSDIEITENGTVISQKQIVVGESFTIKANLKYANADKTITWTQEDITGGQVQIQTASKSGENVNVKATAVGTLTLKATCEGKVKELSVMIDEHPAPSVKTINIDTSELSGITTTDLPQKVTASDPIITFKAKLTSGSQFGRFVFSDNTFSLTAKTESATLTTEDTQITIDFTNIFNAMSQQAETTAKVTFVVSAVKTVTLEPDVTKFTAAGINLSDTASKQITNNPNQETQHIALWNLQTLYGTDMKYSVTFSNGTTEIFTKEITMPLSPKYEKQFAATLNSDEWEKVIDGTALTLAPTYINKQCTVDLTQSDFTDFFGSATATPTIVKQAESKLSIKANSKLAANGKIVLKAKSTGGVLAETDIYLAAGQVLSITDMKIEPAKWNSQINYDDVIEVHFQEQASKTIYIDNDQLVIDNEAFKCTLQPSYNIDSAELKIDLNIVVLQPKKDCTICLCNEKEAPCSEVCSFTTSDFPGQMITIEFTQEQFNKLDTSNKYHFKVELK